MNQERRTQADLSDSIRFAGMRRGFLARNNAHISRHVEEIRIDPPVGDSGETVTFRRLALHKDEPSCSLGRSERSSDQENVRPRNYSGPSLGELMDDPDVKPLLMMLSMGADVDFSRMRHTNPRLFKKFQTLSSRGLMFLSK